MVAYALETDVALLPYIPELLADLEELGSDAEVIAEVIDTLELPDDAQVIDLGCGKGATALEVAAELDLDVLGIELFEPFVQACNQLARERKLSDKCRFIHGNILELAGRVTPADVAVFAALGDVIGRLDEAVGVVRKYVKPGGFIVVSDVFVADGGTNGFPGFEQYVSHDETIRRLTASGDRLVREVLEEDEDDGGEDEAGADSEGLLIAARAETIAARNPDVAAAVRAFAASQAAENDFIDANFQGAVWVLKRSPA